MPDYGHPLRFGAFVTPVNEPATQPVELAVAAEDAGLDLVTFQDHPYQARFHDTWTLLSFVAARTERVMLSANVTNLPLRPPAVLARAAASLDHLSGGRVALGIGAGGFWDAIAAMGGPRRTPGESIEALEEAIEIIRGIWDPTVPGGLSVNGRHYVVEGAARGPAPVSPIPIWIGAYKPRILRLVGRLGDGWLPSLPYLRPGDLTRGNAIIDEAATAAGREPRHVERLLNIGPDQDVEDLVDLALTEGVSTFILMGDDPQALRRFGREVAPAVRERVAAARGYDGASPGRGRPAIALARRREGIDYDGVPESLAAGAVEPGDTGYHRYTSSYLRGGSPGLVLRPPTAEQVSDAVRFAQRHTHLPLGIFSAGHGISGRSLNDGGLVIDVSSLNTVEVLDPETGRVRVGPGARWVDVARALSPHGLAITSGDYGGVGVGGLATAGGIGWFARQHGLTIDHMISADLVLADGTPVRVSETENPDLFWAVRGAGSNFGVATSFEFTAKPVGQVAFAMFAFDATDTAGFLQRWGTAIESADRRVTGQVVLGRPQGGRQVAQAMLVVNSEDEPTILRLLQPIAEIAPLVGQPQVSLGTYDQVIGMFFDDAPQQGRGEPTSHSGLVRHLTPELAQGVEAMLQLGATYFLQIRAVGGAVADVPADATAYGWRDANFSVAAFGTAASRLDPAWERLLPHFEGLYLSFETSQGEDVLARAFPPGHLARLRELKRRYDPEGLFRDNFFIAPALAEAATA
jgi:hypothetical protein